MTDDLKRIVAGLREALNESHADAGDWGIDRGLVREAADAIDALVGEKERLEKGLNAWHDVATRKSNHERIARATARVAISHLREVLNQTRTRAQHQKAEANARDWLISIGSDPVSTLPK